MKPGVHGRHAAAGEAPAVPLLTPAVPLLKKPGEHSSSSAEPEGQYAPSGHTYPVAPSVGAATEAPLTQTKPAAQAPVGAVSPGVAQNAPPLHGVHCAAAESPPPAEKVPLGHGNSVAKRVPAGQ